METNKTNEDSKLSSKWNFRVIKRTTDAFEGVKSQNYYSIEEVFYDEEGNPAMHTSDIGVNAPTMETLKELVERLNKALKDGIVDEIVVEDE